MEQSPSIRIQQVSELYHHALSELVLHEIQDPNLRGITITHVTFTPDLKLAKVYFHTDGGESEQNRVLKGFVRSKNFIKKQMAQRVHLKYTPDLRFYYDNTFDEKRRIDELFQKIGTDQNGESEID